MHKNVVWGIQSKWYSAVILFIFSCMASPCFATVPCVTVGPFATGNGTGADWNDVKALPGSSGWAYGTRYSFKTEPMGNSLSVRLRGRAVLLTWSRFEGTVVRLRALLGRVHNGRLCGVERQHNGRGTGCISMEGGRPIL